jgi:hypothetical protein
MVLPEADGMGIRSLIVKLMAGQVPDHRRRPERQLFLGHHLDGMPVHMDPLTLVDST